MSNQSSDDDELKQPLMMVKISTEIILYQGYRVSQKDQELAMLHKGTGNKALLSDGKNIK